MLSAVEIGGKVCLFVKNNLNCNNQNEIGFNEFKWDVNNIKVKDLKGDG